MLLNIHAFCQTLFGVNGRFAFVFLLSVLSSCNHTLSHVQIEVSGENYVWKSRHAGADGKLHTTDDIIEEGDISIPANCTVELAITSQDNLYFWTIDAFDKRALALKGRLDKVEIDANGEGVFPIDAGQMCGYSHESLKNNLVAISQEAYLRDFLQKTDLSKSN